MAAPRGFPGLIVIALAALSVVADEPSEPPRETILIESVQVQAFYLCDGYDTYGDASFYDCARRFFREGARPTAEAQLGGVWHCVSAVNGPTANYEQPIKFGHHKKGRSGEKGSADVLLVQKIFGSNPSPKKMYRTYIDRPNVRLTPETSLIGRIERDDAEWTSTPWAYVQVARPLRFFAGGTPAFYDTRAAFRFRGDRLLIEHVASADAREEMWQALTADPRSDDVRRSVREKRASHDVPTVADAIALADELVNEEIYRDGNPFRTEWTEQSIKSAKSIALYATIGRDATEWSFPIAYSECRRGR